MMLFATLLTGKQYKLNTKGGGGGNQIFRRKFTPFVRTKQPGKKVFNHFLDFQKDLL